MDEVKTDNQSQPKPESVNLSKTIYDTLSGLFPKFESDPAYKATVDAYKEAIFNKLSTGGKPNINKEKMSENIRFIVRQFVDQQNYLCVFLIHKDYLNDLISKDMKSNFKIFTANFNASNALIGELEEYPKKVNPT